MSTMKLPSFCVLKSASRTKISSGCSLFKTQSSLGSVQSIIKSFGLKTSFGFRASAMAVYKITLINPEGKEAVFEAKEDAYVLDSAENAGVELPFSCRAGVCSKCAGKVMSGSVEQSDGSFLDDAQMNEGYLLTCVSYPTSDCVIHTHKETELPNVSLSFGGIA